MYSLSIFYKPSPLFLCNHTKYIELTENSVKSIDFCTQWVYNKDTIKAQQTAERKEQMKMEINKSVFSIVRKEGKFFVKHSFNGEHFQSEDLMMIYGLNSTPYVKRLGTKMYLPEDLVQELREVA